MKNKRLSKTDTKSTTLLVSILLLISVSLGGTIAYLAVTGNSITNIFNPSTVTTSVDETREGKVKSNVRIENTGDTDAWIRATVVVTWKNDEGEVYGQKPLEGTDYEVVWNKANWIQGNDGFWYYKNPVPAGPGKYTDYLITSCEYKANAPTGYYLNVEILGSGIQSKPVDAFNSWAKNSGIKVDGPNTNPMTNPMNWKLTK